jgi:hypothetical protein
MRIYYFDKKDGVPVRDNKGIEFAKGSEAIEYSKRLAAEIRREEAKRDADLSVVVVDESGTEIHSEPVYAAE